MGGKSLPLQLISRKGLARLMRHPLAHIAQWRGAASPRNGPCVHHAPSLAGTELRKLGLSGDTVDLVTYAPCSKRPELHVVLAATGCVAHILDLANRCRVSNRPAQLFCLAS